MNVYPLEIERVLNTCPGVRESVVFAVPDEQWGQHVRAAVAGTVTRVDLDKHARAHLVPAKRPKSYHLVPELPRPVSGELSRGAIAASLELS